MEPDKIPLEQALRLASDILGGGFKRVNTGRNNWVFEDGCRILTIPRHERVKGYAIRVAAANKLKSGGIPVAEILEYSKEQDGNPEYLIVQKVDGCNADLTKMSIRERESAHRSAGEVLGRVHSILCSDYGRLDKNLVGVDICWEKFTDDFFRESLGRVEKTPDLWQRYGQFLIGEYEKGRGILRQVQKPSFLHADFHMGNILFKDGKVAAILDLDLVTSGDTNWDTGHYCHTFNFDRVSGVRAFREGYGPVQNSEAERLYNLVIWTKKIGTQALRRPEALKETIPELEKIIRGEI
jgi:aminoglycoside phosphotransferase (APT) family kinase protein